MRGRVRYIFTTWCPQPTLTPLSLLSLFLFLNQLKATIEGLMEGYYYDGVVNSQVH